MSSNRAVIRLHESTHRVARSIAFCLGVFCALNVVGQLFIRRFDANVWWIDTRVVASPWREVLLSLTAAYLLAFACGVNRFRVVGSVLVAIDLCLVLSNIVGYYGLLGSGTLFAGPSIPASVLYAMALATVLIAGFSRIESSSRVGWRRHMLALALAAGIFPLLQFYSFGRTDYRRKADAIVVFGSRAYADGRPSLALADRISTGCQLLLDGYADTIVFSGGPGDGDVHETEAMRRMAIGLGVPAGSIVLDDGGVNTQATVDNVRRIARERGATRLLAVSHFFHLPRIKLTFERAGLQVFTVPCQETRTLALLPMFLARETLAFWFYYARPAIESR